MTERPNSMPWAKDDLAETPFLVQREWLVTNGLGGYASGTIAGVCTRRFHGPLVAALPAPVGRTMMLNHVQEEFRLPGGRVLRVGGDEVAEGRFLLGEHPLSGFRLEQGLPVWRYEADGVVLEKSLVLPHRQNTVFIRYRLVSGRGPVRLRVRPSLHFRPHEGRVDGPLEKPYRIFSYGRRFDVIGDGDLPPLRISVSGADAAIVLDGGRFRQIFYATERARGCDCLGQLWSPGYARADLHPGTDAALGASTEPWETFMGMEADDAFATERARRERLLAGAPEAARSGLGPALVVAADQFLITPETRVLDAAHTRAIGDDVRSVIAGYHWFTDWGRDTMISLEGLALDTGRHREAGHILRMFGRHFRDGLIPNFFPEGKQQGVYHAADATLWYLHALDRYVARTGDRDTLRAVLPALEDSVRRHLEGTRFGIRVDPDDGLLRQGQEGCQLTWMDAKVQDWVVTPRRGKAVEINALWYNALRLMERWTREERPGEEWRRHGELAARVRDSFNRRFWNEARSCLHDVVDAQDDEGSFIRPNQLLALSLPHPVLDEARWRPVLETVDRELFTPVGLRSLARGERNYRARYDGNLRDRDAAYHQGTVWAWLIGPFVDAWLRVHPGDKAGARERLKGFEPHLAQACVGQVSEIFDAEPPYTPRGCVAQAWSVAELLRAWIKTAP